MNSGEIKVVIADDNIEVCSLLSEYLSNMKDFKIAATVHNGADAINVIREFKPDLLILDMIMPKLDGLAVLEMLNKHELDPSPKVIVLSAIGQDNVIQMALGLGVDYYMVKPFDFTVLISRIREIFQNNNSNDHQFDLLLSRKDYQSDLEEQISKIIRRLGIPAHISGYNYLREAILMVVISGNSNYVKTKYLYPSIAQKYNTTTERVERAIRHAIESTWDKVGAIEIYNLIDSNITFTKGRPTPSEFIALISDNLKMRNHFK